MILSVFITVISGHDKPQPPGCLLEIAVEAMLLQKLTVDLPDIPISGLSVAEGDAFDKLKISIRIRDITITQDVVL
ncbi:hypothetical protein DQW51_28465 [Escherichia coli O111:H-]|nr:hypothetical protein DQW51_28465 [Escherichia coli O111:H-]